jgi:hypothetical protein
MDNEKLFAIKLADNEKKVRDKALTSIRKYIEARAKTEQGNAISILANR